MLRWFSYVTIFAVSAFVLHFFVSAVVAVVTGMAFPNGAPGVMGPLVLVADFGLAGVVTWLITKYGGQLTRNEEDERRGQAFLDAERNRVEELEHQHVDKARIDKLVAELNRWRHLRDLRATVNEALAELGDGDASTLEGTSLRDELTWALEYADSIDPLKHKG